MLIKKVFSFSWFDHYQDQKTRQFLMVVNGAVGLTWMLSALVVPVALFRLYFGLDPVLVFGALFVNLTLFAFSVIIRQAVE